jgi:hypothetical protein
VLLAAAWQSGAFRKPQQTDPEGTAVVIPAPKGSTGKQPKLEVPSAAFMHAMSTHVEQRRIELGRTLKTESGLRECWIGTAQSARLALLQRQLVEVQLAVSAWVGGDVALLLDICPELCDPSMQRLAEQPEALAVFLRTVATGGFPARSNDRMRAVEAAVSAHVSQGDRAGTKAATTRAGFVPCFRRSCLLAFCAAVCDEVSQGGEASAARAKELAAARKAWFWKLGRGALIWAGSAIAIRLVTRLLDHGL